MSGKMNGHSFPDGIPNSENPITERVTDAERIAMRDFLEQRAALGDQRAVDLLKIVNAFEAADWGELRDFLEKRALRGDQQAVHLLRLLATIEAVGARLDAMEGCVNALTSIIAKAA